MHKLCPGCEKLANEDFTDVTGRSWHRACALRALGDGFRTPLDLIDATAAVAFESTEEVWQTPHSFHLREIILCDDVELSGVYLGNKAMVYALQAPIRPRDLPERKLIIDHDFQLGLQLNMNGNPKKFKYRLVGERRPESVEHKPGPNCVLAVGSLRDDELVGAKKTAEARFCMPGSFRGERVVCDDWKEWEIVDVQLGVDPGRSTQNKPMKLTGYSTDVTTYTARVGEMITYTMRNIGDQPRRLVARVYGLLTW